MNREIKFRAWDGKRMVFFDTLKVTFQEDDNGIMQSRIQFVNDTFNGQCSLAQHEVMQYTGLKDKNGKEIYEGDVLQYKYYGVFRRWWTTRDELPKIKDEVEAQKQDPERLEGVVEYLDGSFCVDYHLDGRVITRGKSKTSSAYGGDCEERWWDFEVVGNIYENPELVKP